MNTVTAGNFRQSGKDLVLQGYQIPKGVNVFYGCKMLVKF